MSGEQYVEVKFAAERAGLILPAGREQRPRLQVTLEAAMVDEYLDVHLRQFPKGAADGLERFVDLKQRHSLRLFPAAHKGRAGADKAHAQAVFQHVNGPWADGQRSFAVADVAAKASGVQVFQIGSQRVQPHVEIVIAEGDVLIAARVERLRAGVRARGVAGDPCGEGRTLQHVAPVDDERVLVAREGSLQLAEALFKLLCGSVVGGHQIAVDVGCVNDVQLAHSVLLPGAPERRRDMGRSRAGRRPGLSSIRP